MAKRILIVDDGYGDRLVISSFLQSFGYQVVGQARNTDESIEKYRMLKPDLVIMDVTIPDVDSISAINRLMQVDHTVNVIVSVSHGQRVLAMEAMRAGAKDFVTKPINPRALHRVIKLTIG